MAWPYPSGPMHVGHGRTYTIPDVVARYKRMKGFNALFPMGWHLTGSPILGATQRMRAGEEKYLSILKDKFKVPDRDLERLKEPLAFADYWISESRMGYKPSMSALGYSIDWKRECTSLDPHFSRMVEWQYRNLRRLGLVTTGSHPVKFCPRDQQAVTDHDLLEGEGVGITEFTLIKYRLEEGDRTLVLPAATLRPETIFGVTNIWLHPEGDYVEVATGGERWVVSRQASGKLSHQGRKLEVVSELKGAELIGKRVKVPYTDASVPILPATFVQVGHTTGVVGSVPAHAPFDLVALRELQADEARLSAFKLDPAEVRRLRPIEMIEVEGRTDTVIRLVAESGIRGQSDSRGLDSVTKQAYKIEFAKGVMAGNTGPWKGQKVSRAKEDVKRELIDTGLGDRIHEFTDLPVVCRCGTPCVVKTVQDQWFIRYSDESWKQKVRSALGRMKLIPPDTLTYYLNVVDWLNDWPCTRRVGMGTKLPWDETGWIIESLSDSTIYMAYYTLVPWMKLVRPEQLRDEIFDHVFLGEGDPAALSASTGISEDVLRGMRSEFTYWYPQDFRVSANELIPNHLTFMVFHHLACFPEKYCPEGIVNLGVGVLEGSRMSSSKGVVFAVADAVEQFGADVTRFYLMYMCEPWQDFDWRGVQAEAHRRQVERFFALAQDIISMRGGARRPVDGWMLSRVQHHVEATGSAYEGFQTRRALQHAFFLLQQDIRWYLRRGGTNADVLREVLDASVRLLAPITPHLCEEIWERLGRPGFVSAAPFPSPDPSKRDPEAEFREDAMKSIAEDIGEILKVTRIAPKRIVLYSAPEWKWKVYRRALAMAGEGELLVGALIKAVMEDPEVRKHARDAPRFAQKAAAEVPRLAAEERARRSRPIDERAILQEAREFLARDLGVEVLLFDAEAPDRHDPQDKARQAVPLRPAIYIEG